MRGFIRIVSLRMMMMRIALKEGRGGVEGRWGGAGRGVGSGSGWFAVVGGRGND